MVLVRIARIDRSLVNGQEQIKTNYFTIYTNKRGEIVSEDIDKRYVTASVSTIQIVFLRNGEVKLPTKPIQVYDYSGVKWIREEDLIFALGFES